MSNLPVVIYSAHIDPAGVLAAIEALDVEVEIRGVRDDWTELLVLGRKRFLRPRLRLSVLHDSAFYRGDQWQNHVRGLEGYFGRFPQVPYHNALLHALRNCRFILSLAQNDLYLGNDARWPWVLAMCEHLDGVLMTPAMLLDKRGRVLISAENGYDTNAELPEVFEPPDAISTDGEIATDIDPCEPPSAHRVAARAIVLAALAERGMIENEYTVNEKAEEARLALLGWLREIGVSDEVDPEELEILRTPFGKLDQQRTIAAVWRIEGLSVLLWALRRLEIPRFDQLVDPQQIWQAINIYDAAGASEILSHATLRTPDELSAYRTHATMANWRLRNYRVRPGAVDFVEMSRGCWIGRFDISRFAIVNSDLAIDGVPIDHADPGRVATCEGIADERHLAINWLSGWNSPSYSATDTST